VEFSNWKDSGTFWSLDHDWMALFLCLNALRWEVSSEVHESSLIPLHQTSNTKVN
jgi:hypothetical protein